MGRGSAQRVAGELEIFAGARVGRAQPEDGLVFGDGFARPAEEEEDVAEVGVGGRVRGLKGDDPGVSGAGLGVFFFARERVTEREVFTGFASLAGGERGENRRGFIRSAELEEGEGA